MTIPTRERIIEEALRLFAEKGYSATAVSEIEAAAGLSPGAGGLYRHFRSKEEVLAAAVRAHAARTTDQIEVTLHSAAAAQLTPLPDRLRYLCELGLAKMSEEANLIRVIFRDLDQFPQLVDEFREDLVQPLYEIMTTWGCRQPEFAAPASTGRPSPPCSAVRSSATGSPTRNSAPHPDGSPNRASWRHGRASRLGCCRVTKHQPPPSRLRLRSADRRAGQGGSQPAACCRWSDSPARADPA